MDNNHQFSNSAIFTVNCLIIMQTQLDLCSSTFKHKKVTFRVSWGEKERVLVPSHNLAPMKNEIYYVSSGWTWLLPSNLHLGVKLFSLYNNYIECSVPHRQKVSCFLLLFLRMSVRLSSAEFERRWCSCGQNLRWNLTRSWRCRWPVETSRSSISHRRTWANSRLSLKR